MKMKRLRVNVFPRGNANALVKTLTNNVSRDKIEIVINSTAGRESTVGITPLMGMMYRLGENCLYRPSE